MKKPRKVLRKVRAAVEPAVDQARVAAREVFERIQAAHDVAAKALKKGGR